MRKIKVTLETGYSGATYEDFFEVGDDMTEDEINEMIWDHMTSQYIEVYFEDVDEDEDDE